jgi:hypothetical protein
MKLPIFGLGHPAAYLVAAHLPPLLQIDLLTIANRRGPCFNDYWGLTAPFFVAEREVSR